MSRLATTQGETYDLAIVGGGIIGSGIARDAALRGLQVALFERRDFGSGTTAASTRIVHGGLRYLQMLDFRLVRLDLRERETLLRIAPHLVRPLEFLIPFYENDRTSAFKLRAGLALYDALSFDKSLPSRRWLPAAEARTIDFALRRSDLRGAAAYYDARVDSPERLTLENVLDAENHGARVFNYCEVVRATPHVRVRDTLDGTEVDVNARVIVNATGAWMEPTTERFTGRRLGRIRTTKGIHIVVPPLADHALVLYSQVDGRLLFAIPRGGLTWIGTTDTDYPGDPADARATAGEVQYLVDSVQRPFPNLTANHVLFTTAGVRALVRQGGRESSVSRMHKVVEGPPAAPRGVISVLGGKITGYRAIAEDATDAVCRRLGARNRTSSTADTPLPGARTVEDRKRPVNSAHDHLDELYGTRAAEIRALAQSTPELARPLSPKYPEIGAEVVFAVRFEHCTRLSDFLRRRTLLGTTDDQGWEAAAAAAELMANELGWSRSRIEEETTAYREDIARTLAFRDKS
ncbi:MAG: glycerol-3-phosphate dehydrogenase/oxidase [Vicinamibacterales bacterium]